MTRNEFIKRISDIVGNYIEYYIGDRANDPQIKINPLSMMVSLVPGRDHMINIEYSDEAIEEAAAADDESYADAMDRQARQNPDYYAVSELISRDPDGKAVVNHQAIDSLADTYFPKA